MAQAFTDNFRILACTQKQRRASVAKVVQTDRFRQSGPLQCWLEVLGCEIRNIPVQRNKGIDAFLRAGFDAPIPIRVQRPCESLLDAATALRKAAQSKKVAVVILVATSDGLGLNLNQTFPDVIVVDSAANAIDKVIKNGLQAKNKNQNAQVRIAVIS